MVPVFHFLRSKIFGSLLFATTKIVGLFALYLFYFGVNLDHVMNKYCTFFVGNCKGIPYMGL